MNYYNDNDPKKAAWLRQLVRDKLIPAGDVDERPIQEVCAKDLAGYTQHHFFAGIGGWSRALEIARWPQSRKVATASLPCQPFSNNGKKLGCKDPRHLWPGFFSLVRACRFPVLFGEQVASEAGRVWLDQVRTDLANASYEVGAADLCAASVGADHIRARIFWGAYSTSERQSESGQYRYHSGDYAALPFREADRFVHAVRRGSLPFLCGRHHGLPISVVRIAAHGFGDAIVPALAAEFIQAAEESHALELLGV